MGYSFIPDKERNAPFGFSSFNQLIGNLKDSLDLFRQEHNPDGVHNSLEVARTVGSVVWGGATYSLSGFNAHASLAGGNNPSAGKLILTLAADKFTDDMVVQAAPMGANGNAKPELIMANVVSATSVEFYLHELTSALGGSNNNAWALTDLSFAVRISANPFEFTGTDFTDPTEAANYDLLGAEASRLNRILTTTGDLRKFFLGEHISSGAHNVREVARVWGYISWNGAAYSSVADSGIASLTRLSAGVIEVNFDTNQTTPYQVFVQPDYARDNSGTAADKYVVVAPIAGHLAGKITLYVYAYSAANKSWSLADTNLYVSVHGAPT